MCTEILYVPYLNKILSSIFAITENKGELKFFLRKVEILKQENIMLVCEKIALVFRKL